MGSVYFVLVLCTCVVSCTAENQPEDEEILDSRFSRGPAAYLADVQNQRNESVTEERIVTSEQRKDGIHHKVTITKKVRVPYTVHVEKRIPKIIEVPVDKPFNVYVPKPYPVITEKKVPYEIKVPLPQPYTVEKRVPYPVKVLVDKPYTLHVPKPYPVEVEKKYEFEVEKKIPIEVKVPVERRYPVHVIVEKEVKFPVETRVPVPVRVPHDKPIPIHVTKHVPVHVDKPVPYTLEKVATYPVKVPFRIPVKVHYPEGESMEGLYSNSYSKPELQNLEWLEAMTSSSKAVRNFEQNHFRTPVRQGFSIPPHRRPLHPKNAYYFNPSKKRQPHHINHYSNRTPTKLHPVNVPQTSYEVTERQPNTETLQVTPFLKNPDSEVIVPQLLIGSVPQQGNNMLLSQAVVASVVQAQKNVSNEMYQPDPSFKMSQSTPHNSATPFHSFTPSTHSFNFIPGHDQNVQTVHFGKPPPSFAQYDIPINHQVHDQNSQLVNNQPQSQVPSATFFRPAPQNAQSSQNQKAADQSHQIESSQHQHRFHGAAPSFHPVSPDTLESSAGEFLHPSTPKLSFTSNNLQPSAQQRQPSGSSPQSANLKISSSYFGSSTTLGGQEHGYSASIQHHPAPQQ